MALSEQLSALPPYAFPRLRALLDAHAPGGEPVNMTIGEPRHPPPQWLAEALAGETAGFGVYPPNDGHPALLDAIAAWIARRHGATVTTDRLMVANGTREALFNAALALVPETKRGARPILAMPNPFYPVYGVAALATGAEPLYLPATLETGFLPDFRGLPPETLDRIAIAWICSPANPQGAVAPADYLADLIALAERHDFRVFADECYSEIWRSAPPPGILAVAAATGADPERVVAFNSLSKRSNVPGLRSGFVAAGPRAMTRIRQLRAYAGAPVPLPIQMVSARLWADEAHVEASRALYQAKFAAADRIMAGVPGYRAPEGGFFLWLPVGPRFEDGEAAALDLWRRTGVRVLPGAYLGRDTDAGNPGLGYIRVALVAPQDEMERGLARLRTAIHGAG
jgi:aspartate/methionine/tyrosine aminotransferase